MKRKRLLPEVKAAIANIFAPTDKQLRREMHQTLIYYGYKEPELHDPKLDPLYIQPYWPDDLPIGASRYRAAR